MTHAMHETARPCGCTAHDRVEALLLDAGADSFRHAHGRTLYDHLIGTRDILRRWLQPPWVQDAGALHSVYSTEAYRLRLVAEGRRAEIAAAVGERSERLAHLFGVLPRRELFALAAGLREPDRTSFELAGERLGRRDVCSLLVLHMANYAEQAEADDQGPAPWLARVSRLGALLTPDDTAVPPIFDGCRAVVTPDSERLLHDLYRQALVAAEPVRQGELLRRASAACPWVGEPYVLRAQLELAAGRHDLARLWAEHAERLLTKLGVAWDKRRPLETWLAEARETRERADRPAPARGDGAAGRERFQRYVESFGRVDDLRKLRRYSGLRSQPWYDPADFPVVALLEDAYPEIRREILAVDPGSFHAEAERIHRTGSWDVLMFHERGRRNTATCARCPVTAAALDHPATVKTLVGLIYASRLRPGTAIAAHRGPTNMRLRCHLPLQVPAGDCAIRVGEETRGWVEGRCLVFDDSFEHEAWNRTDEERIVLVVDLWHPDLSADEVALLEGLHRYTAFHAEGLGRYWAANDRARAGVYH